MKLSSRKAVALAVAAGIALPSSAFATNGYFLIGYGPKSRAMGGVGIALAQDGIAAASNPAGMALVKMNTMRVDVAGEFFVPRRAAYHNSSLLPADEVSASNLFLIPTMGGIYKFNRKITVGMAAIGAGLGTRYNQKVDNCLNSYFFNFQCNSSDTVGVAMMQMQMLPSIAYKVKKNHYIGASLAIAVQTFRAYGLESFGAPGSPLNYTSNRNALSNNGNDWSYGAGLRLGWVGKFFKKKLSVGLNYSSRVKMTKFKKYAGLFAEQGSFDIPENYGIGLAWKFNKQWLVAADVTRNNFSSIASVGNPGPTNYDPDTFIPPGYGFLGEDNGMGFGWKDQTVYKLGLMYKHNKQWTFRAGYNYGKAPIPSDQILFSLLAPGVVEHHATIGFSYRMSPTLEFSMNYMYAFKNTITGKTPFWPDGVSNWEELTEDNAAASMYQHSLGFGIAYQM